MRVDRITESQWPEYLQEILNLDDSADYTQEINWWHDLLEALAVNSFDAQASPTGEAWGVWDLRASAYHSEERALINTGRLRSSFFRGDGDNVDNVSPKGGQYGTDLEYAATHQLGLSDEASDYLVSRSSGAVVKPGEDVHAPTRPMLGYRKPLEDRFVNKVADALIEHMKG